MSKSNFEHLNTPTRWLLALFVLDLLILNVFLFFVDPSYTNLHLVPAVWSPPLSDSWQPMLDAYNYITSVHDQPVYSHLLLSGLTKFQYPPSSLLVVWLVEKAGLLGVQYLDALRYLSLLALTATVGLAQWIFVFAARMSLWPNKSDSKSRANLLALGVWALLTVSFYPLMRALYVGQIQLWLDAMFATALCASLLGRERTAGAVCGLMCLLKPQYALVLVWALLRQRRQFALCMFAALLIGTAISCVVFGLTEHVDYLRALTYLSQHGESYYPNQSMNGLLNRLLRNGNNLVWLPNQFAPYNQLVYCGTLAASLLLIGVALWPFEPKRQTNQQAKPASVFRSVDLCIIFVSVTMASPIAWDHHYGLLLPMYALALPTLATSDGGRKWAMPLLLATYVMTSNLFVMATDFADTPFNFVQSYLYLGASIFLLLLYRIRGHWLHAGDLGSTQEAG